MALGKNIHIKKEADSKKSNPVSGKKENKEKIEKKKLISKNPSQTIKPKIKSDKSNALINYITEEILKRKSALRERYLQEIEASKGQMRQFIVFNIGEDEFAVDIALIKEVVPFSNVAKIPNTPKHIIGATIVRGQTITAIDLESRFTQITNTDYQFTISLKNKKQKAGLLVKKLPKALKIDGNKIDGNLRGLESTLDDETYIKGIIKDQNRLIFYLDIDELIEGDRAIVVPDEIAERK